ncbi:MAG: PIN domain-containing protein [bacterium]|nr:PIN domain-containing protein [bacterium]
MKSYLVDTNILVRFLVGDNKSQQEQARKWFKQAESGECKLILKPIVLAETSFVLQSVYKKSTEEVATALDSVVAQKWLVVEERAVITNLWQWYKKGLHFVDSYLLTWAKTNSAGILTFDKELTTKMRK